MQQPTEVSDLHIVRDMLDRACAAVDELAGLLRVTVEVKEEGNFVLSEFFLNVENLRLH